MQGKRIGIAIAALALCAEGWWAARLAYANLLLPKAPEQAARLDPWSARYAAALADRLEFKGADAAAIETLRHAAALDPLSGDYLMRLAIRAESAGDTAAAERLYLRAAEVDHLFAPRIALANFYFRQGRADSFWPWMRRALEVSYGDLSGTLELCWTVAPDANTILQRALPRSPRVLAAFLRFALEKGAIEGAQPVAQALLASSDPRTDPPAQDALLEDCDHLISTGRLEAAWEIWNKLHLPADSDFARAPIERGFDWKLTHDAEMHVTLDEPPGGFSIAFSGKQPESGEVLSRISRLDPDRRYVLHWEYRTTGDADPGLAWRAEPLRPGIADAARTDLDSSEPWKAARLDFASGHDGFVRLVLTYARRPGTARYQGSVSVRRLSLAAAPDGR